jgi:hypothetical protein
MRCDFDNFGAKMSNMLSPDTIYFSSRAVATPNDSWFERKGAGQGCKDVFDSVVLHFRVPAGNGLEALVPTHPIRALSEKETKSSTGIVREKLRSLATVESASPVPVAGAFAWAALSCIERTQMVPNYSNPLYVTSSVYAGRHIAS